MVLLPYISLFGVAMKPTSEQDLFLCKPVPAAIIRALAGTGKTTLFRMFAQRYPELRFLYLSYNRSIVDEANLPSNCLALTGHQLAYRFVGYRYANKMSDNLSMGQIKNVLKISWAEANLTKSTLENFFYSQDKRICHKHVPFNKRNTKSQNSRERVLEYAKSVWDGMCCLDGKFPMTQDGYLKGYSLADIDLSNHFDVLLVDEAQDLNPAVQSIIDAQSNMKKYLCGDDAQQLYRYRRAEDALNHVNNSHYMTFCLTQSFRFNDEIADFANSFLMHLQKKERLTGTENGIAHSIVEDDKALDNSLSTAYINRTILKTIEIAIEQYEKGIPVMWVGRMSNYPFDDILDVLYLKLGQKKRIKSRDILRDYKNFEEFQLAAKATGSIDMARILRIIKKYGTDLFDIYKNLRATEVKENNGACTIVSTCHRAKGLEFPQVVLGNDFKNMKALLKLSVEELRDELNLMYVGVTRTQLKLVPSAPFYELSNEGTSLIERRSSIKKPARSYRYKKAA